MKKKLLIPLFTLIFILSPVYSYAVSSTDAYDFVAAEALPSGTELPEFYTHVENTTGLYIFMTADGTVHKRLYGSVDGNEGWYIAHGVDNAVYSAAPDADLAADRELYYASPWVYTGATTAPTHAGLLAPQEGVLAVDEIFGTEPRQLFKILGLSTAAICIIILIAAGSSRKSKH